MDRRQQIKQWLKDVLECNLSGTPYRAFIFGSQANKEILSRSDIDLGIVCDDRLSVDKLVRINNAVKKLPMLYNVDVVDFSSVDEHFKAIALSNVEML